MTGLRRFAIAVFIAGLAALYIAVLAAPYFGMYYDDGVYLVNAKALAEGRGYRIVSLPDEIPQTKYPPAFPALLAAVWKLWPSFPDNLPALKLAPALFGVLWAIAGYALLKLFASPSASAWIVLLSLASGMVVTAVCGLLPDSFFAFFSTLALLLLARAEKTGEWRVRDVAGSAACLGIALLSRTMGMAFLLAAVCTLVWRRKFRLAILYAAICGVLYAPWMLWVQRHPAPSDPVYAGYSKASYRGGHILSPVYTNSQRAAMVAANLLVTAGSSYLLLPLPGGPIGIAGALAITALALIGYVRTARRGFTILHAWVLFFLGLLTVWAWPPLRYLIPVQFAILLFACLAAQEWLRRYTPRTRSIVQSCAVAALAVCAVVRGVETISEVSRKGYSVRDDVVAADWRDIERLAGWIRDATPADATIAANTDIIFYMLSGRKGIRGFYYDAYDIFYAGVFGESHRLPAGENARALRDHLRANRITHVAVLPLDQFIEDAYFRGAAFQLAGQGLLRPVRSEPASGLYLFAVDRERM